MLRPKGDVLIREKQSSPRHVAIKSNAKPGTYVLKTFDLPPMRQYGPRTAYKAFVVVEARKKKTKNRIGNSSGSRSSSKSTTSKKQQSYQYCNKSAILIEVIVKTTECEWPKKQ